MIYIYVYVYKEIYFKNNMNIHPCILIVYINGITTRVSSLVCHHPGGIDQVATLSCHHPGIIIQISYATRRDCAAKAGASALALRRHQSN